MTHIDWLNQGVALVFSKIQGEKQGRYKREAQHEAPLQS